MLQHLLGGSATLIVLGVSELVDFLVDKVRALTKEVVQQKEAVDAKKQCE
jgi:hypothetical protein